MVVPHALFADEREVKLGIERGNGNIEAVDLVGKAVGIGDGVGRGLEQLCALGLRVLGKTRVKVQNRLGDEADVDGHLAIFNGERSLTVAGLVRVEHGAVGVEFRSIHAVGKGGLCGLLRFLLSGRFFGWGFLGGRFCGFFHGLFGSFCLGCGGLCVGGLLRAAGQNGRQQQNGQHQGKKLFHFGILLIALGSGTEFCPGARFFGVWD